MKTTTKILAALAGAGVLGAGSLVLAQPGPGFGGCDRPGMMRGMRGVNFDPGARAEWRLAQLKTDLKVTAEQEPLWQAFADKAKSEAGQGFKAMREQAQEPNLTAPERMARMTGILKQRLAAMEGVQEHFTRLYEALTPEQKKVADLHASRMGVLGHHGPAGRRGPPLPSDPKKG